MESILQEDIHDTAIVVVFDDNTSNLVLIRSSRTGLWRFPGDRVRDQDIDFSRPDDRSAAAYNAISRITKERTGLTVQARHIAMLKRPFGMFYGYVGIADFGKFVPKDKGENTKIFRLADVPLDNMPPIQRSVFNTILQWVQA